MAEFTNQEAARLAGERVRWSFGSNWRKYTRLIDDDRLAHARASLIRSFDGAAFEDRRFLDVGCGSGLFSLAARSLGADVVAVDVDPNSVASARSLGLTDVRQASILRDELPSADLVYSWGVLHHTGAMWEAVRRALTLVNPGGLACLGLYTQPVNPQRALRVKRSYNRLPDFVRPVARGGYGAAWLAWRALKTRQNPLSYLREYPKVGRGMSYRRDVEDWLGGLPFEWAESADVAQAAHECGFEVARVTDAPPAAVAEYLLRRLPA